jgi:GNAT superfamily N-acetyltransferase
MDAIRQWLRVLTLLPCAILVFLAYKKTGYYPSWLSAKLAVGSYYKEKRKLGAKVFVEYLWGCIPIGTLMCSVDSGWLPIDVLFPEHMKDIRRTCPRIGYLGKFAVLPTLCGKRIGLRLIHIARSWCIAHGVTHVVAIVAPRHVTFYKAIGFVDMAYDPGTLGDDCICAPSIIVLLDATKARRVIGAQYSQATTAFMQKTLR